MGDAQYCGQGLDPELLLTMNAAVPATIQAVKSGSAGHARSRALALYRNILKEGPTILVNYNVPLPLSALRDRVAHEFRRNADLEDAHLIDIAIFRGEQELDETVKMFKTPTHVWRYIDPEIQKHKSERIIGMGQQSEFLHKFYSNDLSP